MLDLDLICLGRAAVDFYGEQIGGRLEDMATLAKYLGGSSANIAYGASRLGLRVAMLTRVGDEHLGRFVREELARGGVDVAHVVTDPERPTGLVVLGIRDRETFPLIFYRENCADMAIHEDDFDADFIGSARALLITGTHFSTASTDRVSRRAIEHARARGVKVVVDIDYRPVLWGLTGRGLGEQRYVASERVTQHLQSILPLCDLVVGTEEEVHIAGGTEDTRVALQRMRACTAATLVLKRGPLGCVVFEGAIPDPVEAGVSAEGVEVQIFNVLGAGDAFMAGFLSGWLRGASLEACCRAANACGALVVSRHACAPAMPTREELEYVLARPKDAPPIARDEYLRHLHRVTTRARRWPEINALAFDHRRQFVEWVEAAGVDVSAITPLKALIAEGARLATERAGAAEVAGFIVDDEYGGPILDALTGTGPWIARPVERPGSRPLEFAAGEDVALTLRAWPREHVAKVLVFYAPDDPLPLRAEQLRRLRALYAACGELGRELLVEIIPPPEADLAGMARSMEQIYAEGIRPDWWKIPPPQTAELWADISRVIDGCDPHCRGVLLLGLDAPEAEIERGFSVAAGERWCRGFAVGRSLFAEPARRFLRGEIDRAELVDTVADNYGRLIALWRARRTDGGMT